jgi:hypothetical protein
MQGGWHEATVVCLQSIVDHLNFHNFTFTRRHYFDLMLRSVVTSPKYSFENLTSLNDRHLARELKRTARLSL